MNQLTSMPETYVARFQEITHRFKPVTVADEDYALYLALLGFSAYLKVGECTLPEEDVAFLSGMGSRLASRALGSDLLTIEEVLDEGKEENHEGQV
ncbi:MAG: hypothetical protein EXS64_04230 [Candidatus Latescibacteria bacterium]|nr:hypothetical protein [Candidatus Latescibacterota bacterium]